ncbi:MAG: hypothetical protein FWF57_04345 [Defluviitaleaceae bacterium]|nr:hypothetical protein [Defluviitaleaceae bacterium]
MLDFKTELKKYQPILDIEDVEENIHSEEIKDIIDLLQYLSENNKN